MIARPAPPAVTQAIIHRVAKDESNATSGSRGLIFEVSSTLRSAGRASVNASAQESSTERLLLARAPSAAEQARWVAATVVDPTKRRPLLFQKSSGEL